MFYNHVWIFLAISFRCHKSCTSLLTLTNDSRYFSQFVSNNNIFFYILQDSCEPLLSRKFNALLDYFQDSSYEIKEELLLFLREWAHYYGHPQLHAIQQQVLRNLPGLKHELREYTVLVNIKRQKVRIFFLSSIRA